ncbi:MAG: hypothetical protein AAF460_16250 [Pseudomonadota bacterium]
MTNPRTTDRPEPRVRGIGAGFWRCAVVLCAALSSQAGRADFTWDWQGSVVRVNLDVQRYALSDSDFDIPVLSVGVGVPVRDGIVLDVTVGRGLDEDGLGDLQLGLGHYASASLRMVAPPGAGGYRLLSRFGASAADLEQSGNTSTDTNLSGLHFSLGVQRAISSRWAWSLEAIYLRLDEDITSTAVRGGLSWTVRP